MFIGINVTTDNTTRSNIFLDEWTIDFNMIGLQYDWSSHETPYLKQGERATNNYQKATSYERPL